MPRFVRTLVIACPILLAATLTAQTIKPGVVVDPSTRNEDVLVLRELAGEPPMATGTMSAAAAAEIRRRLKPLAAFAVVTPTGTSSRLYTEDRPTREQALVTVELSLDAAQVLGLKAEIGRLFTSADAKAPDRVAVLVNGAWRRYFGASPEIISKAGWLVAKQKKENVRIVGVLTLGALQNVPEIDPKAEALILSRETLDRPEPGDRWYSPVIRLNRGVSAGDVQTLLDKVAQELRAADPAVRLAFRLETLRTPR